MPLMLYLHGGLPRTSTTSLQTALATHEKELASVGIAYPRKWRSRPTPTHHGLHTILKASQESPDALDELMAYLEASDGDVLFSAEILIAWLQTRERLDALLALLAAARRLMPVRCIWTLRRRDEALASLYLFRLAGHPQPVPVEEAARALGRPVATYRGMNEIADLLDGEVVYVKYSASGSHNPALLESFGIPEPLRGRLRERLRSGPRLNVSLSHKQAIALAHVEQLAERAGVELDADALRSAIRSGDLRFERDWRCDPLTPPTRRKLHRDALMTAEERGFAPYLEFFGDSGIEEPPAPFDVSALSDEDVGLVADCTLAPAPQG